MCAVYVPITAFMHIYAHVNYCTISTGQLAESIIDSYMANGILSTYMCVYII